MRYPFFSSLHIVYKDFFIICHLPESPPSDNDYMKKLFDTALFSILVIQPKIKLNLLSIDIMINKNLVLKSSPLSVSYLTLVNITCFGIYAVNILAF